MHIAAPLHEQTFLAGATVIVQARIENAGPDLAQIRVLLNDETLGEQAQPNPTGAAILPLTIDWRSGDTGEFTIAVAAERGDGESAKESVTVFVISDLPDRSEASSVEGTIRPVDSLPGTTIKPANLRAAPAADAALVANIPAEQTLELIARDATGDWYQAIHGELEAWVFAEMIDVAGDISLLPTAGESTAPDNSAGAVNLVIESMAIKPNPLVCGEPGELTVIIGNDGESDTSSGGFIDIRDGAGEIVAEFQQVFSPVPAGGSVRSHGADITLLAGAGLLHTLEARIDSSDMIAETNEDDNTATLSYTLAAGDCA